MSRLPTPSRLRQPSAGLKTNLPCLSVGNKRPLSVINENNVIQAPTAKQSKPEPKKTFSNVKTSSRRKSVGGSKLKQAPMGRAASGRRANVNATKLSVSTDSKSSAAKRTNDLSSRFGAAGSAVSKSKRPAWDTKGRLMDVEALLAENLTTNNCLQERLLALENQNNMLEGTVKQKEIVSTEISQEAEDLRQKLRSSQQELYDSQRDNQQLLQKQQMVENELTSERAQCSSLRSTVVQLTATQAGLTTELEATKFNLEQTIKKCQQQERHIKELDQLLEEFKLTIQNCESKIREDEQTRRRLHNTIQELKGNIRVYCRVRPLLPAEAGSGGGVIHHINFFEDDTQKLELEKLSDGNPNESTLSSRGGASKFDFEFDRVFKPVATQSEVFEEISQLVQSALDGYNVCIFAYGQTGSGKTFTMEGPDKSDDDTVGMIPRAVMQIFREGRGLETQGWKYKMEASFLEIYNETVRDLLCQTDKKLDIKKIRGAEDVDVADLTVVNVTSEDRVYKLLKTASENRAVATTKCNDRSSRSHSVFRMKLSGANNITGETCKGTLNLVDLAGSERIKESGSSGQRLEEAKSINKSLSTLGQVILALANKDSHVPYRNSKLTYLLQNSLGGNSKTLMFVNVSPREEHFSETLNSLRFAKQVNNCNIGTARQKR